MRRTHQYTRLVFAVALATGTALGLGCSSSNNNNNGDGGGGHGGAAGSDGGAAHDGGGGTGGSGGAGGTAGTGGAAALSDAQIGAVMLEANNGEVAAAQIATAKAQNGNVLAFAMMMINDHSAANTHLSMVLQTANIAPADSAIRANLAMQASQAESTLLSTPTASFDRAYIQSQVTMHMMVLQLLDGTLIPQAQNTELKAELQAERATVMTHLADAQQLLAALSPDGGADGGDGSADGSTD
jgi:putative membrane protein